MKGASNARRAPGSKHLPALLLWAALALLPISPSARAAPPPDETSVRAAYVINFVRYSRWPRLEPGAPLVIVTLGSPEAAAALRQLADRAEPLEGHALEVRPLSLNPYAPGREEAIEAIRDSVGSAHAVYVPGSHRRWNEAVVAALDGRPVLTIGVGSEFVEAGGMFGLVTREGRVVFTTNNAAIARNPVDVSARVLMLARPPRPGEE